MTQAQYELLTKIEQGTTVFRPDPGAGLDPAFTTILERLIDKRVLRPLAGAVFNGMHVETLGPTDAPGEAKRGRNCQNQYNPVNAGLRPGAHRR